jgi:hypothetical protein
MQRASILLEHSIPVAPLPPRTKAANTNSWQTLATTDLAKLQQLNPDPDGNTAAVARAESGGFCFFEVDAPDFHKVVEKQTGQKFPETLMVSSSPGNGRGHFYFRHTPRSIAFQRALGKAYVSGKDDNGKEAYSFRMDRAYVVGPGSVKDNGEIYTTLNTASVADCPDWFIDWVSANSETKKTGDLEQNDESPIAKGSRNSSLASILGKARQALKMDGEELYEYGRSVNQKRCVPPLPDSEVRTIADSIAKYPIAGASPIILGGQPVGQHVRNPAQSDPANWRDNFKSVGELEQGDVRMLIDGFLPEGTTFIGGLPGEGKTLFALSIAKALTTGDRFLGKFSVPEIVPVIYLIPESGGRAFRKRCEKFNIPNDPELFLCRTVSEGATLPLDDASLFEAVRRLKPVVILDTLIRFSEADDENAATQNKKLVDDVIRLRQAGAVAVIGLHHATKAMREKAMTLETALRGTGDIAASADAVYGLLRDSMLYNNGLGPNEIDVACLKPRDFEPPMPFRIALTQKSEKGLIKFVSTIDQYKDFLVVTKSASDQASGDTLERLVKDDPAISLKELATATGQTTWQIRKTLKARNWVKTRGGAKHGSGWIASPNGSQAEDVNPPSNVRLAPDVSFDSVVTKQAVN